MRRDSTVTALRRELRQLRLAQSAMESAPRSRVSVWHKDEAAPEWPDKRPHDLWIVVDLCGAPCEWPANTVHYSPPPTVERFMGSNAPVRCIVGPVGSGKTTGSVMELLRRACEQRPGPDGVRRTRFAIIRNSYRELKDTSRRTFAEWVPLQLGSWSEQDFTFRMNFADVQSEVLFRSLDRPEDIKKLLSLELTAAFVNEARELSKQVFDTLTGRVGRYPAMAFGGPTWHGVFLDTNPWHPGHWADKLFKAEPKFQLFRQPSGRSPEAENVEHLVPGYYEDLVRGKDSEWVRIYIDGQDSDGAVGSVYGRQIDQLEARGGLQPFDHLNDGVFTVWDLGWSDATSIFWFRFNKDRLPDVIDWYEATGQPMEHYFDVVDSKPFKYVRHHFPHDSKARSLQTGLSILEQAVKRWPGKVGVVPNHHVEDGIAAARWMLEQPMRIHPRCAGGVEALRAYRYEWDELAKVFSKHPVHDASSHSADSFRYLACVVKQTERQSRPPPPQAKTVIPSLAHAITIDQLFENDRPAVLARRKRI